MDSEKYNDGLTPEQKGAIFRNNPDLLSVLAIFMVDLFTYGNTPEQQAMANKSREMLEVLGLLKYEGKYPILSSLKELLRKMTQ